MKCGYRVLPVTVGRESAGRATLSRSVRLFRLFLREQADPDLFYTALAADSVQQIATFTTLAGRTVLDVGGGPGYFAGAFVREGARYVSVELDVQADLPPGTAAVRASGTALPFLTGSIDVVYCSNVVEHVRETSALVSELIRVTAPAGTVFLSYTLWWSPWGGHETAPWHYLGGRYARNRYLHRNGCEPKNRFGESLFAVRLDSVLRIIASRDDVELLRLFPRYHPRWAWWTVQVPIVRELLTWNAAFVIRRR